MINRDMKNYRANENVIITKTFTYLIVFGFVAALSWMTHRDADWQEIAYVKATTSCY